MSNTIANPATRLLDGVELPGAGSWTIDPSHAEVAFIGRHFMLTKVRGHFTAVAGTITVSEDPGGSTVEVTIDTSSVASGDAARDDHLRSSDFFDVEHFPTATFRGRVSRWSASTGQIVGDLTIKDVSRPVTLDVEYVGFTNDPWGGERMVFSAAAEINREDWGLTWNVVLETGGLVVSKDIRIEIELEATFQR